MRHDPLNDAMSMLKNAETAGKGACLISPTSKLIGGVLKVMEEHGYIEGFEYVEDNRAGQFKVKLQGNINKCGVIRPRSAVKMMNLEKYESRFLPAQDFGVLILTTTAGVISHNEARKLGLGGKLLAYVY